MKSVCDYLMAKKMVSTIVDVCLVAAANFGGTLRGTNAEKDEDTSSYHSNTMPWETGLYESRGKMLATSSSAGVSITPSSSNAANARKKCYTSIFDNLHELLLDPSTLHLADEMLSGANKSMDELFHHSLYKELIGKGHVDTLLRLRGPFLRSWLEAECNAGNDKVSAELLWRYFTMHNDHAEAARIIIGAALQPQPFPLGHRISYLTRGVGSLSAQQNSGGLNVLQQLEEVQSNLDVANVQNRILDILLSNIELSSIVGAEKIETLSKTIVNATKLLNEYAAVLQLWDFCLIIIHCCRSRGESFDGTIQGLWRTIIGEILPRSAAYPEKNKHAAKLLNRIHEQSYVEKKDDGSKFEEGRWIVPLKSKIVSLGNELYGSGADHTFPLVLLSGELETLRRVYNTCNNTNKLTTPWSLTAFLEVGCTYQSIIQAYDQLFHSAEDKDADIDER